MITKIHEFYVSNVKVNKNNQWLTILLIVTLVHWTIPFFSFRIQLDTAAEIFLEVWGSIVDESINNCGLTEFPPWSKPFGPL